MEELRSVLESDDIGEITAKSEALTEASHKLAQAVYEKAQAQGAASGAQPGTDGPAEDEVIEEGEYEVVDEEARNT
jgi:molecular chaperone DnaK